MGQSVYRWRIYACSWFHRLFGSWMRGGVFFLYSLLCFFLSSLCIWHVYSFVLFAFLLIQPLTYQKKEKKLPLVAQLFVQIRKKGVLVLAISLFCIRPLLASLAWYMWGSLHYGGEVWERRSGLAPLWIYMWL